MEKVNSKDQNIASRIMAWMVDFMKRQGFLGVFLMAAWPNAFFDLCGICCGQLLMPFWTFFLATLAGKAGCKIALQLVVFITLFTKSYMDFMIDQVANIHVGLATTIRESIEGKVDSIKSGKAPEDEEGILKRLWGWFILIMIAYFVVGCINQFA